MVITEDQAHAHKSSSCSLLKFIIRALPHWFYFTPKPDVFPPAPLLQRPYIATIFGSNLFCIMLHTLLNLPAAGEASHGFLHGGLLIDFIGQQSPVSRIKFLGLDLLTLVLQLVMLAVTVEKQKMQGKVPGTGSGNVITPAALDETAPQDHDAEEQGILRSEDAHLGEDIELRSLPLRSDRSTGGGEDEGRTRDELFDRNGTNESYDTHPMGTFYTGDYLVADLHLIDTVRTQWNTKGLSVNAASTASGMQTAATLAGRRITLNFGNRH